MKISDVEALDQQFRISEIIEIISKYKNSRLSNDIIHNFSNLLQTTLKNINIDLLEFEIDDNILDVYIDDYYTFSDVNKIYIFSFKKENIIRYTIINYYKKTGMHNIENFDIKKFKIPNSLLYYVKPLTKTIRRRAKINICA